MDYPKFIVSDQKEESISIQRVKDRDFKFQNLFVCLVFNDALCVISVRRY